MVGDGGLVSIAQARERAGISLRVTDFISTPIDSSSRLFLPGVEVQRHLFTDQGKAAAAVVALEKCVTMSQWGKFNPERGSVSDFERAASEFSEATDGVSAVEVIEAVHAQTLARMRPPW